MSLITSAAVRAANERRESLTAGGVLLPKSSIELGLPAPLPTNCQNTEISKAALRGPESIIGAVFQF
jgi:hypothetical protein